MCVYIHIYTDTHIYIYVYIYTHTYIYIHTHTHIYIYTHIYKMVSFFFFHSRCYLPSDSSSSHSFSPVSKRMFSYPTSPTPTLTPLVLPTPWGLKSLLGVRCIFSQGGQTSALYVPGPLYQLVYAAWLMAQCLKDLGGPG